MEKTYEYWWFAVQKNGTEVKFNNCPYRNLAIDVWRGTDNSSPMFPIIDRGIELPKGTIEKLIGKELTWDDEPQLILDCSNYKQVNKIKFYGKVFESVHNYNYYFNHITNHLILEECDEFSGICEYYRIECECIKNVLIKRHISHKECEEQAFESDENGNNFLIITDNTITNTYELIEFF